MATSPSDTLSSVQQQELPGESRELDIKPYLRLMVEKDASDLFFTTGAQVKVKISGKIRSVGRDVLDAATCKQVANSIMSEDQRTQFEERLECDFAIALDEPDCKARYRVNAFNQRGDVGLVLRLIPSSIPTVESLGLPPVLRDLVSHKRGVILVVGATGSGKSTTLASMIDYRNENFADHILSIEDPIEFSHQNKKSIVNQREVGIDTLSYGNALKAAVREAPNVILIGEVRDQGTMETVMELCNTGHLVLSTLHANNANQTLERIINLFPPVHHKQLLMDLSLNVRAIISQRLVNRKDVHGRVAAIEIMISTPHIADLILKGEIGELKTAMRDSGAHGMQTFDQALFDLYKADLIDLDEALSNADSRADLEARINFG